MNTTELESPISSIEAQETANASSTYSVAPTNCQAINESISSVGNIENYSPPNLKANNSSTPNQDSEKAFAPVITHDVTLPNTTRKVPMVTVPVQESRTMMAMPISTINRVKETQMDTIEEQQARDLLVWNDGVGTLDGCDLRFKLNQLGCLELLDSDDELENQNIPKQNAISSNLNQNNNNNNVDNKTNIKATNGLPTDTLSSTTTTSTTIAEAAPASSTSTTDTKFQKRAKLDIKPAQVKQISPGSSLLRDGPNIRRPKSSSGSNFNSLGRSQTNSLSLLKKIEQNHNSILLDKLVPKQRLDEIKTNIENWTIKDVKNFIDSIPGCSGYGELFELQQICGKSLMYLDQRDLLDVINLKLGPAVKIYHAISLLK